MLRSAVALNILLLSLTISGCGKSNEQYQRDVEKEYSEILVKGIDKSVVISSLKAKGLKYLERNQKECEPYSSNELKDVCDFPSSVYSRIEVGRLNLLVDSGAHTYFLFNSQDKLVGHRIEVRHSFI